jgi:hypothetical protein
VDEHAILTRAYEALKTMISKDQPVMIHVDMPYLKYLGLPEQVHFGAHMVVVAGLDEDKCLAHIADNAFKSLQTTTLKELEDARSSPFKPFPAENKWIIFEFPTKLAPIGEAVKTSVTKNCDGDALLTHKKPQSQGYKPFRKTK